MKKKIYLLSLLALTFPLLGGCDFQSGNDGNSSSAVALKEPSVSFNLTEGQQIDYGSNYDAGFTVTPSTVEYEWAFKTQTASLDHVKPTEIGSYKLEVVTEANDEYKSVTKSVSFQIVAGAVKVTPTLTILVGGSATENGLTYYADSLPAFSYNCSEPTATVEAYYTADDGETNLGTTAPTTPGTYAYNVKVVEDANFNTASAFIWYIISAPKQDVTSMTLTFNNVEYTANNWNEKYFVIGETAPTWSVVTDPADAQSHVQFWITLNEQPVEGWPTQAGDYVFCCGIKSSDTAYNAKYIYVAFKMVTQLPSQKTVATITCTIKGTPLVGSDWNNVYELPVNSNFADVIQFSTNPSEAASDVVWEIQVLDTEAPTTWDAIKGTAGDTVYKLLWKINPDSENYTRDPDTSATWGAGTKFVIKSTASAPKQDVTSMTLTFNNVEYTANNWNEKYFVIGETAPTWSVVTDPVDAQSHVEFWITLNEEPVEGWPTQAGDYVFCCAIKSTDTAYNAKAIYVGFKMVAQLPSQKTVATITCTIKGTPLVGSDWNNVYELPVNSNFADVIQFSTNPSEAASDVIWEIQVLDTEAPTTWDAIKGTAGDTVYKLLWKINPESANYERDPDTSAGWGAGTKFVIKSTAPAPKQDVTSMTLTFNNVEYTANNWNEKYFVVGETAPTWSVVTDPVDAQSHVEFWITLNEEPVEGWPTQAGDYVFCCAIKSTDTAYNAKAIYVAFTMVA